jgi:branched-subunit amino acid aminotransferase/4-amino-4-deoxychorismate lyase
VYPLEDLLAADEAFTSSSVREVMPVIAVDDHPIQRGPAADALQKALREEASR